MTQHVYLGEFADGEERIAYAVEAESYVASVEWLKRELLADADRVYPLHWCDRQYAANWLASRAQQGQMVAGNIPEAEEIESVRVDAEWNELYAALRHNPKQLREWIEFQRSLRDPRDRMWVFRCVLSDRITRVAGVVITRTRAEAIAEMNESVHQWMDGLSIHKGYDLDCMGRIRDGKTDRKAIQTLALCKSQAYQLLGHLQVIGGEVLDSPAGE